MEIPAYPKNIGDKSFIKTILGEQKTIQILDEILVPASGLPSKLLCFQKVLFIEDNKIELRLAYYMVGVKGRAKGKWVWGQYATFIEIADMTNLVNIAKEKGWL